MFGETKYNLERFQNEFPLPFILNSIGSFDDQEDVYRPSGHPCNLIIWVTAGEGEFVINGNFMHLTAGNGVFIAQGVPHSYHKSGDTFSTSWFSYWCSPGVTQYYGIGKFFPFEFPSSLEITFENAKNLCYGNSNTVTRSGVGYAMLIEFLQTCFASSTPLHMLVDQYLESYFGQPISLDDVANAVNTNKFTLCKKYLNAKGITVIAQLNKIRVSKAKYYLSYTNLPMQEIGKICGFENPSYFGKVFKEATGISPKSYRNRQLR